MRIIVVNKNFSVHGDCITVPLYTNEMQYESHYNEDRINNNSEIH